MKRALPMLSRRSTAATSSAISSEDQGASVSVLKPWPRMWMAITLCVLAIAASGAPKVCDGSTPPCSSTSGGPSPWIS